MVKEIRSIDNPEWFRNARRKGLLYEVRFRGENMSEGVFCIGLVGTIVNDNNLFLEIDNGFMVKKIYRKDLFHIKKFRGRCVF